MQKEGARGGVRFAAVSLVPRVKSQSPMLNLEFWDKNVQKMVQSKKGGLASV